MDKLKQGMKMQRKNKVKITSEITHPRGQKRRKDVKIVTFFSIRAFVSPPILVIQGRMLLGKIM